MLKKPEAIHQTCYARLQARPLRLCLGLFCLMLTIVWAVTFAEHRQAKDALLESLEHQLHLATDLVADRIARISPGVTVSGQSDERASKSISGILQESTAAHPKIIDAYILKQYRDGLIPDSGAFGFHRTNPADGKNLLENTIREATELLQKFADAPHHSQTFVIVPEEFGDRNFVIYSLRPIVLEATAERRLLGLVYYADTQALMLRSLRYRSWQTFLIGVFLAAGSSALIWLNLYRRGQELRQVKRFMDALSESEERMKLFVSYTPVAVAMFDRDMVYLAFSQRWRAEYGFASEANLIRMCHFDLAPESAEKFREIQQRCLHENAEISEVESITSSTGKLRWIHWEVQPWLTVQGETGGVLVSMRDITESVNQQEVLREQASRLDLAIQSANLATWDFDVANEYMHFGGRGLTILGFDQSVKYLSTRRWYDKIHPEDRDKVDLAFNDLLTRESEELRVEYRIKRINGTWAWMYTVGKVTSWSSDGLSLRAMGVSMDISESKERELALELATTDARQLASAIDSHSDAVLLTDAAGNVVRVNQAYETMTGYQRADVIGNPLGSLELSSDGAENYREMWAAIRAGHAWSGWQSHYRKRNSVSSTTRDALVRSCEEDLFWVDISVSPLCSPTGVLEGFVAIQRDVTDEVKREQQLALAARTDELTGLGNRKFLQSRLERAVELQQKRGNHQYAVLFMDVDRFKLVNDSLGHQFGDCVLREIAARLRNVLRSTDEVMVNSENQNAIRWGGDEFVVLLEHFERPEDIVPIAERILAELSEPCYFSGHLVQLSVSIGIVIGNQSYLNASEILRDADTALYEAKNRGKARWVMFDGSMQKAVERRLTLESELRSQRNFGQFYLVYQPIVSADDGCLRGVEALIRWKHPELGLISPLEFIPIAEDTRFIVDLGQWVIKTACQQWLDWQTQSPDAPDYITINLSRVQLDEADFVHRTTSLLAATGIDPTHVVFEITESTVMKDTTLMKSVLQQLKQFGVRLAIDDFGTGYSSLSCLHEYPFDILKVDRSFVSKLDFSGKLAAMTHSIIQLGRHLGMACVAEGAENELEVQWLRSVGCDYIQGYYFGRPLAPNELLSQNWPIKTSFSPETVPCNLPTLDSLSSPSISYS